MSHDLAHIFRKVGLKTTPTRKAILGIFSADCKPINAEYIHEKLKTEKINLVTIYRTLSSFENTGIIKKIELQKGSAFYELAGNHHHHIVCADCGKTEGFEICDIDRISKEVLKKSSLFKTVNKHSLELFGVCKTCSNSKR
jgi:Fur family ferric uptake transcriptional regulator